MRRRVVQINVYNIKLDVKMRKLIPAIVILVLAVIAGTWLFINLRCRHDYTLLRDEVVQNSPSVVPMDEDIKALVAEARGKWEERYSQVDGPATTVWETIRLRPCVASLVEVCSYQMPAYSFVSPEQNKRAVLLAFFQLLLFGPSTDKSLHVSDDGHLAVMRCAAVSRHFPTRYGILHDTTLAHAFLACDASRSRLRQ